MIQAFEALAIKLEEQEKNAIMFRARAELMEKSAEGSRAAKKAKTYRKKQKKMREMCAWIDGFLACLYMEGVITQEEYLTLYQIMLDMQFH